MGSIPATWDRFVLFESADGKELCGEPVDKDVDVGEAVAAGETVMVNVLDVSSALSEGGRPTGETASIHKLLSPIRPSEVGTVRCVGLNFKDHAAELQCPLPDIPEVFFKPSNTITNPSSPIILPSCAPSAVDAEVELAVIIGRDCRNVSVAEAPAYILGYTAANDVTARDVQKQTSQWGFSKSFDGFCPLGPCIVRASAMCSAVSGVGLKSVLDGEVLQDGSTDEFIFSVGEIVAHLSRDTTLPRGTVILTGTPSGIGHSKKPPRYLKPGCDLSVSITPSIGTLRNKVVSSSKV
ncbi:2-keto-4-pentenoate hydratase/2-oxohepta-3-ene-1,7-dioic acid hydratase (catechol pathway) [Geosmithia morbida]|uniref:2-keto-4-pentenoate hydratase/2-oxohepta-3-ene-1,7-dioic acid hydratase (Catechol pathway) n=1 Tax=Geosmithia morbida TaxID=1094350 RepID=A0A9P4YSD9_9HYPO|nr:2-keto-4-pentenoate hydratase/2-oxohepta-3-ene-1,7-dioic acid hydratase (catechol pathway) [Geosmithia morbida]KAF4121905.1 2-keto-4-pentenoate hydratase/2-oxohepta-3-ene-1,7-dioic acid hydratase (catechol pathway) [Geosmithia morbida]